jgi:hypothetical protein
MRATHIVSYGVAVRRRDAIEGVAAQRLHPGNGLSTPAGKGVSTLENGPYKTQQTHLEEVSAG